MWVGGRILSVYWIRTKALIQFKYRLFILKSFLCLLGSGESSLKVQPLQVVGTAANFHVVKKPPNVHN